jgi:tRNA 2-thiouridine synthesizing protein B
MVHLINKSPLRSLALENALRIAREGDPVLLIEDAVHACRPGARSVDLVSKALEGHPVYALKPDLDARAVGKLIDGIEPIGYDGFVELAEKHQVITWT